MGFPGKSGAKERRKSGQRLIRPAEVVATGLAGAVAAFVTSRFGIAGTVLGTAVAVMIITAASSVIQAYLEGAAGRLLALPRRRVLLGAAASAALSLLVGLAAVTGVELGAGKTLSCWLWDRCPAGERLEDRAATTPGTRPSVLGGEPVAVAVPRTAPQAAGQPVAPQRASEGRIFYGPQIPAPASPPQKAPPPPPETQEVQTVQGTGQSGAPWAESSQNNITETPEVWSVMSGSPPTQQPDTEQPEEIQMPEVPAPGEGLVIPASGG
jgi:hypothetical protein